MSHGLIPSMGAMVVAQHGGGATDVPREPCRALRQASKQPTEGACKRCRFKGGLKQGVQADLVGTTARQASRDGCRCPIWQRCQPQGCMLSSCLPNCVLWRNLHRGAGLPAGSCKGSHPFLTQQTGLLRLMYCWQLGLIGTPYSKSCKLYLCWPGCVWSCMSLCHSPTGPPVWSSCCPTRGQQGHPAVMQPAG